MNKTSKYFVFLEVVVLFIVIIALSISFTLTAYADDNDPDQNTNNIIEAIIEEGLSIVPDKDPVVTPDELFNGYVEKTMDAEIVELRSYDSNDSDNAAESDNGYTAADSNEAGINESASSSSNPESGWNTLKSISRSKLFFSSSFTGISSVIYKQLESRIIKIASGEETNTIFMIDVIGSGYDPWDFDLDIAEAVINRLLAEHPYELYWYDKTADTNFGTYDNKVVFLLPVSEEYAVSGETYVTDSYYGQSVTKAINKAGELVTDAAALSDLEKLKFYLRSICEMTDYNYEAANNNIPYGNPWQLIWVFDDDSSTKVVCEGYSKAFKYLCDLTDFDSYVGCRLITGSAQGAGHMWNILSMDDGQNYLADITNSDTGSVGEGGELFLKGYFSGSVSGGYEFKCGSVSVIYIYDEDALSTYSEDELTLSINDYIEITSDAASNCSNGHQYGEWITEKEATCTEAGNRVRICSVCRNTISEEIPAAGHDFGEWIVIHAATSESTGLEERGCRICGELEERETAIKVISVTPTVELSNNKFVYNGKIRKPKLVVKSGTEILSQGTDYTVKYASGRKNVGKYSIKVTLKGKYKGSKTVYFRIVPKATSITALSASKKAFTVRLKKISKQATGYQLQYSLNKNMNSSKSITIKKYSAISRKVSKLRTKRTYYVRVRTYKTVNGIKYYSAWSKTKKIKTR